MHIRNTITDQLIDLGMIKEIQCRIQRKSLLFSKALNNTAVFFLKQNWVRCHSVSLPSKCNSDSAFSVRKHICRLCYIVPPMFTNSDKGKYKGAGHPVDVRFAPTVAKRRPQEVQWTSALCRPKRQRRPRKKI